MSSKDISSAYFRPSHYFGPYAEQHRYEISWVYFISDGKGLIKIGRALNVKNRLKTLQTAQGRALKLVGAFRELYGNRKEETIHSMFSKNRVRGEWFKSTTELRDFIAANDEFYKHPKLVENRQRRLAYKKFSAQQPRRWPIGLA